MEKKMKTRVWDFGFEVWVLGFKVSGAEFGLYGLRSLGFGVSSGILASSFTGSGSSAQD